MTKPKLLVIADDLTGGADTGVQFAKRGFRTILLSLRSQSLPDLNGYKNQEVIVVNTESRNHAPHEARSAIRTLFSAYSCHSFPFIYKKIDSTLRGNIGPEIEALFDETGISLAFIAPSFPELQRTVVGGIMMVRGKPLSLTDISRDVASPVRESYVYKLLQSQTDHPVGWIDLPHIAAGGKSLLTAIQAELERGSRILTFDAVTRQDLKNITDIAFSMNPKPMLIGSAGLASEISYRIAADFPRADDLRAPSSGRSVARHSLVISGSASSITREQLRFAQSRGIAVLELPSSIVTMSIYDQSRLVDEIVARTATHIEKGHVILKSFEESPTPRSLNAPPIHGEITRHLGRIARKILDGCHIRKKDILLILIGGDTAMNVLNALGIEALEVNSEVLEGISLCSVSGGRWDGLKVVTKAGSFGNKDALVKVIGQSTSDEFHSWRKGRGETDE